MKIWKYPLSAALLINCYWSSLNHGLSLTNIAPSWSEHAHSSIYNQMAFVNARNDFDGLWWLIMWFFLCPQLIWILFVFLPRVHCIVPSCSTFQGLLRTSMSFLSKIAETQSMFFCVRHSSLFWNQLSYFNDHVCVKSNCWNEIREMSIFEIIFFSFEIQTSLVKDPTHYSMQSFDCLVFWKQKWPVVRLKWFFHGSLCPF